ncbi:SCO-spondin [Elysia marginata]|uniref:SCO-spondin n=1 Tax=Elysia marginata TaxID=1093978 RepID=A0AAV4EXD4_9GAST|nr:SCO-spondin [Elysia marginata]
MADGLPSSVSQSPALKSTLPTGFITSYVFFYGAQGVYYLQRKKIIAFLYSTVWTDWSEWSACSVTCNDGFRTRDRNCTDILTNLPDSCIGDYNETGACDVGPIQGVCHSNMSGVCTCDWGYDGNNCELCVGNYTGCYCEYCEDNLIGHDTNCSTPCYNGYASISGGDQCECHENTTLGFWQNDICTGCLTGFILPECLTCDTGQCLPCLG